MAKIVALAAYFYQAAVAFGLLIVVAHWLTPADYAAYSLFISISQFVAIFCFEWIRFACSRFYPGQVGREAFERKALMTEFAACALLCAAASVLSMLFGVPVVVALLGGLVAVLQGASDLHLTMLRFRQEFRSFSRLQGSRATILAFGTLGGVLMAPTFTFAVTGLFCGYVAYSLLAVVMTRGTVGEKVAFEPAIGRKHFVYGSVAAAASVIGLLAPLGLKTLLTAGLGAGGAAGGLLALDLLQRPFVLIVAALQAIQYPDVVAAYDRDGESSGLKARLGAYYALLTGLTLMTAAGIFSLLQPIGLFVISPALQSGFLSAAPFVVILSAGRALTLNMLPTPAHLRHRLLSIFLLSAVDCALLNGCTLAAGALLGPSTGALMGGGMIGALLAMLIGVRVLMTLSFAVIWQPVALSAAGLAAPVLATVGFEHGLWISVVAGIIGGGAFCLAGLYSYFIRLFRAAVMP
jgi:O-antigen/teichoic acid export membrane protein